MEVRLIALFKGKDPGPFTYLQGMRSGRLKLMNPDPEQTEAALTYHRNEQRYCAMLAKAVPGPVDAILSPPSSLAWQAEPYRRAIAAKHAEATDLSASFLRSGDAKASKSASLEDLLDELTFTPSDHEQDFERVVIVDDTFTTGKTAAAVVTLLRHHHLQQSCEVILACPLWLDTVRTEKT